MGSGRRAFAALAVMSAAVLAGCIPGSKLVERIGRLPEPVRPAVHDAVWAHGDPYTWSEQKNVVIEARWSDYRHAQSPVVNHKVYTIDLASRRMRIDDLTGETIALYDGVTWRVFLRGHEIRKPSVVNDDTVGYLAQFEYAAGEMRLIRMFFCLPFNLADDGVELRELGRVRTAAAANQWNVLRATFNPDATGFLNTDRMLAYFNPTSGVIDRLFLELSDHPFYSIPHWAEWADYRRLPGGLLVAHRWEFRMTDAKGTADLGRRLSIVLKDVGFNLDLPAGVFSLPSVKPPRVPAGAEGPKAKTLGVDAIDNRR